MGVARAVPNNAGSPEDRVKCQNDAQLQYNIAVQVCYQNYGGNPVNLNGCTNLAIAKLVDALRVCNGEAALHRRPVAAPPTVHDRAR